ncbi:MAG: MarR family transcriptional regulator [Actinobacteria bacterium]|nr:MAG: MarR family transcriptional regulator [Actinomycetota bacterium]
MPSEGAREVRELEADRRMDRVEDPGAGRQRRPGLCQNCHCPLLLECDTIDYASNSSEGRLSSQVLREQAPAVEAWIKLIRGQSAAVKAVNAQLVADHGLTVNDFECMLLLARAEERQMRRVDLAEQLILTASGITRLLDGLEQEGWVDRAACASDRRVTYAVLTDDGLVKLREASKSHVADLRAFFEARYTNEELEQLAELLGRLTTDAPELDCSVD